MSPPSVSAGPLAFPRVGLDFSPFRSTNARDAPSLEPASDACRDVAAFAVERGCRYFETVPEVVGDVWAAVEDAGVAREDVLVSTTLAWDRPHERRPEQLLRDVVSGSGVGYLDLVVGPLSASPSVEQYERVFAELSALGADGLLRAVGVSSTTDVETVASFDLSVPLVAVRDATPGDPRDGPDRDDLAFVLSYPTPTPDWDWDNWSNSLFHSMGLTAIDATLEPIADRHDATVAQVVLRWALAHPNVVVAPRVTDRDDVADRLAVGEFALTETEVETISRASDPVE